MSFIINKKSGMVWACDKVGDEYLIHRYNYSMFISKQSLIKNWKIKSNGKQS